MFAAQHEPDSTQSSSRIPARRLAYGPALATAVLSCLLAAGLSPDGFQSIVTNMLLVVSLPVLSFVVGVALLTLLPVPWTRLSRAWIIIMGLSLGAGVAASVILLLGLAGAMSLPWFVGWDALAGLLCIWRWDAIRRALAAGQREKITSAPDAFPPEAKHPQSWPARLHRRHAWLWLLTAPFWSLALLAAANAPGRLWSEEGFGYDVLEYHLQVPKEHLQHGAITYLPHNVYANFPSYVELLYLSAMTLFADVRDAGIAAHAIHLLLGLLTVLAVWATARRWSPQAGTLAGVGLATIGWLPYLAGMAYVELGLMLFTAVAISAALLAISPRDQLLAEAVPQSAERGPDRQVNSANHGLTFWLISGLAAGFACGCKYTGTILVAVPLLGITIFVAPGTLAARSKAAVTFALGVLVAFSPWLIKNLVFTGNPLFPLANGWFGASPPGWGPAHDALWQAAHRLPDAQADIMSRLHLAWQHLPADAGGRVGPLLLLAPFVGLYRRRFDRQDVCLLSVIIMQIASWIAFTHLYARFIVPVVVPLALLMARALDDTPCHADEALPRAWRRCSVLLCLIAGALINLVPTSALHFRENPGGCRASAVYAAGPDDPLGHINQLAGGDDDKVLLVGEARAFYFGMDVDYAVVFNAQPFAAAVEHAGDAADVLAWLQEKGYEHVYVNWLEVNRLGKTYGFPANIQPVLFENLRRAGLKRLKRFLLPLDEYDPQEERRPWVDIFEVPPR